MNLFEGEETIGYCENLGSSSTTTVNWQGVLGVIIPAVPAPGAGIIGGLFSVLAQISQGVDYSEYMAEFNKCVEAKINEAIADHDLDECVIILDLMKDHLKELLELYDQLSPESSDILFGDIDEELQLIRGAVEDLYVKFIINSKHEKFNDLILEGLAIEAAGYLTSVAAMKCRGIDQETVEGYADSYTNKIQNRLDKEFNGADEGSIEYQLRNSEFCTSWPDTIHYDDHNDDCRYDVWNGCYAYNYCYIKDGYRLDLQIDDLRFDDGDGCDLSTSCNSMNGWALRRGGSPRKKCLYCVLWVLWVLWSLSTVMVAKFEIGQSTHSTHSTQYIHFLSYSGKITAY